MWTQTDPRQGFLYPSTCTYSKTVKLQKPNQYRLCESIYFQGTSSYAIEILSSNVSLNIGGFQLVQRDPSTVGIIAIYAQPGTQNTRIRNGSILNFSLGGILFDASCSVIYVKSLLIENCGTQMDPTTGYVIGQGIYMGPPGLPTPTSPADILTYVSNVYIQDCQLIENGVGGVILANQNIYIQNCHFDSSTTSTGLVMSGVVPTSAPETDADVYTSSIRDIYISDSTFNSGQGTATSFYGFSFGLACLYAINFTVLRSQCNDNLFPQTNVSIGGGSVNGGIVNGLIQSCQFNRNHFISTDGHHCGLFDGFHVSANSLSGDGLGVNGAFEILDSEANENIGCGETAGFAVYYKHGITLRGNRAHNNRCIPVIEQTDSGTFNANFTSCSGILLAGSAGDSYPTDQRGVTYNICVEYNHCSGNIAEMGWAAGIAALGGSFSAATIQEPNYSFKNNTCQGNQGVADSPPVSFPPSSLQLE